MKRSPHILTSTLLVIDVAILAACLLRIPDLVNRARVPFVLEMAGSHVVVCRIDPAESGAVITPGDTILSFDGYAPRNEETLDLLCDRHRVGDTVSMDILRRGERRQETITLIPAYSVFYIVLVFFIGLCSFFLGVGLLLRLPDDRSAAILHCSFVALCSTTILAWEGYAPGSLLGDFSGPLFFGSYAAIAVLFLLFTLRFPRTKLPHPGLTGILFTAGTVAVVLPLVLTQREAIQNVSLDAYRRFWHLFDLFHLLVFGYVIAGIASLIHSFVTAQSTDQKKKLKWIMYGLTVGPMPFFLLTVIPQIIAPQYAVAEGITLLFLTAIPISFAIAIVRHHLFDIDLIIRRTTVYGLAVAMIVGVYLLLVWGTVSFFEGRVEGLSVVSVVVIAFLFEPARHAVQRLVDRRFFRVQYNFRLETRRLDDMIRGAMSVSQLAHSVVGQIEVIVPVTRIALMLSGKGDGPVSVEAQNGFPSAGGPLTGMTLGEIFRGERGPVALPEQIESGVSVAAADPALFHLIGAACAVPVLSEEATLHGGILLGERRSGRRFTAEDIDLLRHASVQIGLTLDRLALQKRLLMEHAEAVKFEEISRTKSVVISNVSHDLRSPLTSISLFAELLDKRLGSRDHTSADYLRVIRGESARLSRMITTILDATRIEEGILEYTFAVIDFREVADEVMEAMRYQLTEAGFTVRYRRPRKRLPVRGDRDALANVLINVIGNSIKYSAEKKVLEVTLTADRGTVRCRVRDRGVGIPSRSLPFVFQRYYRDPGTRRSVKGIGLGLPMAKHIVDAHHGTISIDSTVGKGTAVELCFPIHGRNHPA